MASNTPQNPPTDKHSPTDHSGTDSTELPPASTIARVTSYTRALENISRLLLSGHDAGALMQAVCREVSLAVPDADMVGITVLQDGADHPTTAASSDPRVNDVDEDQYRADEGPCLEAARTGQMVRVRVDDVAERWPRFAANVTGMGVRSYLSAPMSMDDRHLGALNIYSRNSHGFEDIDEVLVQLFSTAVEAAVRITSRVKTAETELNGLITAMTTRADIDQAKGIIMAVRGVSADEAFALLSERSQNTNVKVSALAAEMIRSISTGPVSSTKA